MRKHRMLSCNANRESRADMHIETWYQLGVIVVAVLGAAFGLGVQVAGLRFELRLQRIDLAMLFKHLGLDQPSVALEPSTRKRTSILGHRD